VPTNPKELKRQRDREYYARHKDEIQKRRREACEKKQASTKQASTSLLKDGQNMPNTPLSTSQCNSDLILNGYIL
jgi:hypothetical protein